MAKVRRITANMKPAQKHFQRIDVLRGVAILLVFLHHYYLAVHQNASLWTAGEVDGPFQPFFRLHELGFIGVKLFFVISGFCIHNSYINWRRKNPNAAWKQFLPTFFHRRFWRILPPYLVALTLFFLWRYDHPLSGSALKHFLIHATLINTLIPGFFYNINPSFWSIAVEWQLYLVYPLFFLLLLRAGGWRAFLGATLVAAVFQFVFPRFTSAPYVIHLPFNWWYDWTIGALVAVAFAEGRQLFRWHLGLGLTLGVATLLVLTRWTQPVLAWALPPLFFAVVLEGCLWSQRPLSFLERAAASLGLCSYSLYLFHQPLTHWAVDHFSTSLFPKNPVVIWVVACLVLFAVLWAFSWVSYRWLELKSVAVGDRLQKSVFAQTDSVTSKPVLVSNKS
jgi:peptidoglycan/LPS O-acetylase OafA/YrhL